MNVGTALTAHCALVRDPLCSCDRRRSPHRRAQRALHLPVATWRGSTPESKTCLSTGSAAEWKWKPTARRGWCQKKVRNPPDLFAFAGQQDLRTKDPRAHGCRRSRTANAARWPACRGVSMVGLQHAGPAASERTRRWELTGDCPSYFLECSLYGGDGMGLRSAR